MNTAEIEGYRNHFDTQPKDYPVELPRSEGQVCSSDCRQITLLTILSKLVMALVMGIVLVIIFLVNG